MAPLVLVLGGTREARALAAELAATRPDLRLVSSLAGRVRNPALPVGEVRIGGFGGVAGLIDYLRAQQVGALIDATHPFAATISEHAATAADHAGVPRLVLRRPGWLTEGEPPPLWHPVATIAEAPARIGQLAAAGSCVFLTTGRRDVAVFAADDERHYLVRTVDPPAADSLPPDSELLLARGPYTRSGERALFVEHDVRLLVTKDSGGESTAAKLAAAAELNVPVLIVTRPAVPAGSTGVPDVAGALRWLAGTLAQPGGSASSEAGTGTAAGAG